MEPLVLSDKTQFPTEEVIFAHIGKSANVWNSFFDYIHANHPDIKEEWRYYNDGKSWLLKVTRKAKTIFWLSVFEGGFRVTFYFTDKARQALADSDISDDLRQQFKKGKRYGKIRGLTIIMKSKRDLENAKKLVPVKLSLK